MNGMEKNKIAAAVLLAGVLIVGLRIFATEVYDGPPHHHEEELEKIVNNRAFQIAAYDALDKPAASASAEPTGPEPILALLADADVNAGQQITKKCTTCHSFEKGGANKIGPNLWNLVGIDIASHAGYAYSDALKALAGNWDYDKLNQFFYKPAAYVEGTKMNFAGLKKDKDRANLIAYLRTLSDTPAALPTEAEIAASLPKEETAEEVNEEAESTESAMDDKTPMNDISEGIPAGRVNPTLDREKIIENGKYDGDVTDVITSEDKEKNKE